MHVLNYMQVIVGSDFPYPVEKNNNVVAIQQAMRKLLVKSCSRYTSPMLAKPTPPICAVTLYVTIYYVAMILHRDSLTVGTAVRNTTETI